MGFPAKLRQATEAALLSSKQDYLFSRFISNMADYCMYFETLICGYHAYKEDHELTLDEICILESDEAALTYDKFALKFVTADGKTVGHVAKHLSKICFKFMEYGGAMDVEIVAKRFNADTGTGIKVPVKLRFIGNKQYLEKLSVKIKLAEQENLSATETGTAGIGR